MLQRPLLFPTRVIKPELLDHADPEEARANLADLVRLNRRFGGHSTIRQLFEKVAEKQQHFTVLDVGAASGDTAQLLAREYPNATVVSLDYNPVNMDLAPQPKVRADAFALPFGDGSFDYVMSSLFLHHFTDEEVAGLLASFQRIARRAVLIADLERHILPYLFLRTSGPFFGWGRITVHDGLISVRAAFRADELARVARQAGLTNISVSVNRPAFRIMLVSRK